MLLLAIEKAKASIRAKVEHPFHVIKNLFAYRKVHLQGAGQELGAAVHPVRPRQPGAGKKVRGGCRRGQCVLNLSWQPENRLPGK